MFIKILSTPHYSVMVFCSMEEVLTQQAKYIFIVTRNSGRYTPFFLALAEGTPNYFVIMPDTLSKISGDWVIVLCKTCNDCGRNPTLNPQILPQKGVDQGGGSGVQGGGNFARHGIICLFCLLPTVIQYDGIIGSN